MIQMIHFLLQMHFTTIHKGRQATENVVMYVLLNTPNEVLGSKKCIMLQTYKCHTYLFFRGLGAGGGRIALYLQNILDERRVCPGFLNNSAEQGFPEAHRHLVVCMVILGHIVKLQ